LFVGKRPTDVEAPRSAGAATGVNETGSQERAQRRNNEDYGP
jgi:hypothetical protein